MQSKLATAFRSLVAAYLLLVGKIHFCKAATISSNTDNPACPGDTLVYTCVSQGTSQRWRISQNDDLLVDHVYTRDDESGIAVMRNLYTFTLLSTTQNHFESMVSVIASISIHNTEVECTGIPFRDSVIIKIAGIPSPPLNVRSVVDEYYDHFSTVHLTWDSPNDDSRVDYYQYQLIINGTIITSYNTSNTTVTITGVVYNKNVTVLLLSFSCVGKSSSIIETIYIAGCKDFNNTSFDIKNSTISQAPGTEIVLSCSLNMEGDVTITCRDDGKWEPDPDHMLCTADTTNTRSDHQFSTPTTPIGALNPETESPTSIGTTPAAMIPVFVLASILVIGLCIVVVLAVVCKLRLTKQQTNSKLEADSCRVSDVNQEYYEVVDTIYETINTSGDDLGNFGMQVMMVNNDAYTENIQFHSSLEIDVTNNEAYAMTNIVPMKQNSSYQAALPRPPTAAGSSSDLLAVTERQELTTCNLDGIDSEGSCTNTPTEHVQDNFAATQNIGDSWITSSNSTPRVEQVNDVSQSKSDALSTIQQFQPVP